MSKRSRSSRAGIAEQIQAPDEGLKGALRRLRRYGRAEVRPKGSPFKYLHRAERERRFAALKEPSHAP